MTLGFLPSWTVLTWRFKFHASHNCLWQIWHLVINQYIDIMQSKVLVGKINLKQIYVGYGGYINYKCDILCSKFMRNIFKHNTMHKYERLKLNHEQSAWVCMKGVYWGSTIYIKHYNYFFQDLVLEDGKVLNYIQYMLVHISLFSCTLLGYIHSIIIALNIYSLLCSYWSTTPHTDRVSKKKMNWWLTTSSSSIAVLLLVYWSSKKDINNKKKHHKIDQLTILYLRDMYV